jgi:putative transposase
VIKPNVPPGIALVADTLLANCEDISQRTTQRVRQEIPTYGRVPFDEILAQARINLKRAVQVLLSQRAPSLDDNISDVSVAKARFDEGLPMEDMLRGYRVSLGNIRDNFIGCANQLTLEPDLIVQGTRLLWELTDSVTVQLSTVYREMSVEKALRDEYDRLDFLRRLVHATTSPEEIYSLSSLYRLPPESRYFCIRAKPGKNGSLQDLVHQIEQSVHASGGHCIVAVMDGDVTGMTSIRPTANDPEAIIGIGPKVELTNAQHSFRMATRLLHVATHNGHGGTFSIENLSWRVAVVELPEVTEVLVRRYLTPLEELGEFGIVLKETAREYLINGKQLGATAQQLFIHVNTLRYRLERFQDITGADLNSPYCVMEVLWALQADISGPTT